MSHWGRLKSRPPPPASSLCGPHAVRILQQLGCLEAVKRVPKPYSRILTRGQDGRLLLDSGLLERLWVM